MNATTESAIKYIAKGQKRCFLIIRSMKRIARRPAKKAKTKANMRGSGLKEKVPGASDISITAIIMEPIIIGILIRKEKRALVSRFSPIIKPEQIVAPEREIPGRTAKP